MIGKIIGGQLAEPSRNEREKIVIANPTDEMLKFIMGYKDVQMSEKPEYDPETQYLKQICTEDESSISVSWEISEIPKESEAEELQTEETEG